MKSKARIVFLALVFLAFLSSQSFGTTVTSGEFQVFSTDLGGAPGDFIVMAGGFSLYVPVRGPYWPANCFFCTPGTVVDISGAAVGTDLLPGFASGVGLADWGNPNVPYESVISFTGPAIRLNHGAGIYTVPFSFSGALCGFDPGTGTCVVNLPYLSGQGTVDAFAEERYDGALFFVDTFDYAFQTPEPGTLALFGSGVIGLAGLIQRQLKPYRRT